MLQDLLTRNTGMKVIIDTVLLKVNHLLRKLENCKCTAQGRVRRWITNIYLSLTPRGAQPTSYEPELHI